MKFLRSKFLLIATAFVFILFMTNDFGLVNIERTAIIMAIGIDFDKENKEYEVTAINWGKPAKLVCSDSLQVPLSLEIRMRVSSRYWEDTSPGRVL